VSGELPAISVSDFARRLRARVPEVPERTVERLHRHYQELRRWNARLSLVGPGTAEEVVERHYAESVAALPWIETRPGPRVLLDVGSGAGFPGLVLAICCPRLRVTLLESRARKVAFLTRAAHLAGALEQVRVVEGFLGDALPGGAPERLDFVALRAVKLDSAAWAVLRARLAPGGLVLQWSGPESPSPPAGFQRAGDDVPLAGGERRTIRIWAAAGDQDPSPPPSDRA
jgi:16S rRNA (guanine527-N7)-methyltransferase